MDLHLKNKVVLITGGASGIGAAIARSVGQEGGTPVVVDCDSEAIQKQESEFRDLEIQADWVAADLCQLENCQSSVARTTEKFGRLDALVNNAGINDRVGLENGTPAQFQTSLERNLLHYFYLTQAALPHLKKTRGSILNISSKTAVTGQGGTSGYVAAKGAILSLTREWAVDCLASGVRVNAIVPAEVRTPLYEKWLAQFADPDERLRHITSRIPLGKRLTLPEEIAAMAVFLLSPKAGHITGQHLYVDGGYVHLDRSLT
jgi:L-fucose dehydrogenase